jgi:hypothetical protein
MPSLLGLINQINLIALIIYNNQIALVKPFLRIILTSPAGRRGPGFGMIKRPASGPAKGEE